MPGIFFRGLNMKIYDISQELFSCAVFPGDSQPQREILCKIDDGDICNLTGLSMCAHNGTHVDAPFHFINGAKTIEQVPLEKFIGPCFVVDHEGIVSAEDAQNFLQKAKNQNPESSKRILIKGKSEVSAQAARIFAEEGIFLVGNESQTVGPESAPMEVHLILLGAEIVLLEGIRLAQVPEGVYFLNAAPIHLGGADGAPCRAILIEKN